MTTSKWAPHQERMLEEHKELGQRMEALRAFQMIELSKQAEARVVSPEDFALMSEQLEAMQSYWVVLARRIFKFTSMPRPK